MAKKSSVLQFKITLQDIEPVIWRRIQISDACTFWDLHVAIQDAMGWQDCHLHHFEVTDPATNSKQLMGIPADENFDHEIYRTLPGWNYRAKDYISKNNKMLYLYDYGDGWCHLIEYEGLQEKQLKKKYPACITGERACPPEDVGGIPGYFNFLEIINDKNNDERRSMLQWVGGKYDSEKFNAKKVKFDNPKIRWKRAVDND